MFGRMEDVTQVNGKIIICMVTESTGGKTVVDTKEIT